MDTFYTNQEGLSSSLTYFASGDGGATGNFVALQENEKRSITAAPLSLLPSPSLAQQQQQESLGNVPYNRLEHFSNTWGGAGGTYGAEPNLKIITNGVSNGCEWNEQQYEPLSSSWSFLSTYNNPSQQFGQHDNVIQNDTRPMVGISELTVEDFAVFKGHDGDLYSSQFHDDMYIRRGDKNAGGYSSHLLDRGHRLFMEFDSSFFNGSTSGPEAACNAHQHYATQMFDIPSSTSIDEWFQPFSGQADKQPPNQTEISPSRHQYLPTFEHGPHGGPSSSYEVYQSSEKKSTPQSAVEQGISKDLPTPPNSWKSNGFGYHTDLLSLQTTHDKLETAATQGRTLPLEGNAHDNGLLSDKDQGRLDQDPRVTAGKNDGFYACFFQGCNQHCRRKSDLPRHIHSVHDRMNNRYINYKCNICGRMKKCKSRIDSVTRHAKICWKKKQKMSKSHHNQSSSRPSQNSSRTPSPSLPPNAYTIINQPNSYHCCIPGCAKSYTSERSLDDHLFTHDHVNNDPITRYCHGCHELKKYTRPEALERHLKQCLGRKDVTNS